MKYFVILLIFAGSSMLAPDAFATHDPNQSQIHSIILPPELKEKTFEEFMDWCEPHYGELCIELEEKRIPNILSPLKQFKSGILLDEIQCKESLILVTKHNGSPACVSLETKIKLMERGWSDSLGNIIKQGLVHQEPEPPTPSLLDRNLVDANNKLHEIYLINPSLGPFQFQDVIVGHGIGEGYLIVDILDEFYDSVEDRKLIIQKIVDITNEKVDIEFIPSDGITPKNIESTFQYVWNSYLHKNHIQFVPQVMSYANTDEGYYSEKDNKVCSPLISSSGVEFYISSTFTYEPFKITGTFIDDTKPDDCQKVWKTNAMLLEPDRILGLWLNNFFSDSKNDIFFTDYSITEIDTHYSLGEPVTFEFIETGYGDPCISIEIIYYQDKVWMENVILVDKIIRDCTVGVDNEFLSATFDTSTDTEFSKNNGWVDFPKAGTYFIEITNDNQRDGKIVASFVVD